MTSQIKKPYSTPKLIVHGDVEKITLGGNLANSDVPSGPNNTAFTPGSP
ncbi:MAG TPA: lasso peptide [Candidatus Obscuribacterales bacterium]